MERYEYICLQINIISEGKKKSIQPQIYKENWYVYYEIRKVMYSLPQAGQIAIIFPTKNLATHGYYQCRHTPGLWRHKWRPVNFYLVVNYFGVKYFRKQHIGKLIKCIKKYYPVSVDWTGGLYCGVILDWKYKQKHATLYMLVYVEGKIHEYQYKITTCPQHAPHKWGLPYNGAKTQWAVNESNKPILPPEDTKYIQKVVGKFLFYAKISLSNHAGTFRQISGGTIKK